MNNDKAKLNSARHFPLRSAICILHSALLLILVGCASSGPQLTGPSAPAAAETHPWSFNDDAGIVLYTAHYHIYTTIPDADIRRRLPDVMEGAFGEYQRIAPGVPVSSKPMDCFLFRNREEWEYYTRENTGVQATTYLRISRGGYTLGDRFATYNLGSIGATLSVAAHEGWHQFAARNFKGRLPPFLEEGIATMFEDISYEDDLPRWNLSQNRSRLQAVHDAVLGNYLYPLDELVTKHAGDVVAGSDNRVAAFYGENWAFATFLWCAEDNKFRPALRRLMSDTADGTVNDPTGVMRNSQSSWNPAGVQPMLERYLGMNMAQMNIEYQKFIRKIAFDDYAAQWN
jgi:hypothetical protein